MCLHIFLPFLTQEHSLGMIFHVILVFITNNAVMCMSFDPGHDIKKKRQTHSRTLLLILEVHVHTMYIKQL